MPGWVVGTQQRTHSPTLLHRANEERGETGEGEGLARRSACGGHSVLQAPWVILLPIDFPSLCLPGLLGHWGWVEG